MQAAALLVVLAVGGGGLHLEDGGGRGAVLVGAVVVALLVVLAVGGGGLHLEDLFLGGRLRLRVRVDDVDVRPHALAPLIAPHRAGEPPVTEVAAVLLRRDQVHRHVHLLAGRHGALAGEGHGEGPGHLVAAHVHDLRAGRPRHLACVLEAPDLGELGRGGHLGAVEDGDVAHEARGEQLVRLAEALAAALAALRALGARLTPAAATALAAPAAHLAGPAAAAVVSPARAEALAAAAAEAAATAPARPSRRNLLVVGLLGVGQLVELRFAQVVVLALEVEAPAEDG